MARMRLAAVSAMLPQDVLNELVNDSQLSHVNAASVTDFFWVTRKMSILCMP